MHFCLRPVSATDLPHWQRWHHDRRVTRYLSPQDDTATANQLQRAIAHWQRHDFGWWTLWDGDRAIGRCGLSYVGNTRSVELGYLLEPQQWGRGLATQAAQTVLEDGVDRLRLVQVLATVHPDNRASQRVLEKLGMQRRGTIAFKRRSLWLYGRQFDRPSTPD